MDDRDAIIEELDEVTRQRDQLLSAAIQAMSGYEFIYYHGDVVPGDYDGDEMTAVTLRSDHVTATYGALANAIARAKGADDE